MSIKNWIKKKLGIRDLEIKIKTLTRRVQYHENYVHRKMEELKEYTRVDVDVGFRGNNTIILTGVYKRRAYVHFYDLNPGEFKYLVEMLKEMQKSALIRHIDAPPAFKGSFDL